jgi:hypothetical protein
LANKVQLTTDGHRPYLEAVEDAFGGDIDYAQLIKIYEKSGGKKDETRYSPAECVGSQNVEKGSGLSGFLLSTNYATCKVG